MNIKNPKQSTIYLMVLSALLSTLSFFFAKAVFSTLAFVIGFMAVGVARKSELKEIEPIARLIATEIILKGNTMIRTLKNIKRFNFIL